MSSTSENESGNARTFLRPNVQDVDGLLMLVEEPFRVEKFRDTRKLKLSPGDVVLSTYPKCGTTWMQYIIWDIINDAAPLPPLHDMNYEIIPFLEMVGPQVLEGRPHPWYVKVHLPYSYTPQHPEAKYIYVARNPKDCLVSIYHFYKQIPRALPADMPFEDLAENFLEGYMSYGDYFDHVLSWYEHKDDPNVLFVTYEEMKAEPKRIVLDVARFLGKEHEDKLLKNEDMLNQIVKNTTFQNMKHIPYEFKTTSGHILASKETQEAENPENTIKFDFFRKGTVGDYKNYMTEDLKKRLDERMVSKLGHTHLVDIWRQV